MTVEEYGKALADAGYDAVLLYSTTIYGGRIWQARASSLEGAPSAMGGGSDVAEALTTLLADAQRWAR